MDIVERLRVGTRNLILSTFSSFRIEKQASVGLRWYPVR